MSAVEIRKYEGDGADLADLVGRTWRSTFTGKMWFPLWDRSFFSWRLLDDRGGGRDFLVAAYQGSKIVGCLLAEPFDLQVRGQNVKATLSSWLSVDPEVRAPNIALRMFEGLRKRHQEHDVAVSLGVTVSDREMPNRKFWDFLAKRKPEDIRFLAPIQFWTRVFDPSAVAAAGLNTFERIGPRLAPLAPWGWSGTHDAQGIRDYRPSDLPRCLEWLGAQSERSDLHLRWSPPRLSLQLDHPYVRTLVLDRGDKGCFLNYYCIDWSGAKVVRVAVIDLFAGNSSLLSQRAVVKAAERRMVADGVQMALAMVSSAAPSAPLLAAGFFPIPADIELFSIFPRSDLRLDAPLRYHLLFT